MANNLVSGSFSGLSFEVSNDGVLLLGTKGELETFEVENMDDYSCYFKNDVPARKISCSWLDRDRLAFKNGAHFESLYKPYQDELCLQSSEFFNSDVVTKVEFVGNVKFKGDVSYFFGNLKNLKEIDFGYLGGFADFSEATSVRELFSDCDNLEKVDLSSCNFNKVEDANHMFYCCFKLKKLVMPCEKMSSIKNLAHAFYLCRSLSDIENVNTIDVSNAEVLSDVFGACENLKALDLSRWNTENARTMSGMFSSCSNLESLDISNFRIKRNSDISSMFSNCEKLSDLKLGEFQIELAKDKTNVFARCFSLDYRSILDSEYRSYKPVEIEQISTSLTKRYTPDTISLKIPCKESESGWGSIVIPNQAVVSPYFIDTAYTSISLISGKYFSVRDDNGDEIDVVSADDIKKRYEDLKSNYSNHLKRFGSGEGFGNSVYEKDLEA